MRLRIDELKEYLATLHFEMGQSELIKSDQYVQIVNNNEVLMNEFEDALIELNNFINNK